MKILFKEVHEVWLATQFTGFMSKTETRLKLYEFANILFKHLTWLENDFVKNDIEYNYNIKHVPIKVSFLSQMIEDILRRLDSVESHLNSCKDKDIVHRIKSDVDYMRVVLKRLPNEEVSDRFNSHRNHPDIELTQRARDALTLF